MKDETFFKCARCDSFKKITDLNEKLTLEQIKNLMLKYKWELNVNLSEAWNKKYVCPLCLTKCQLCQGPLTKIKEIKAQQHLDTKGCIRYLATSNQDLRRELALIEEELHHHE